jgi:competence protein ComEC
VALAAPLRALAAARGQLFPWVPVCMGTGIGLWFALPSEPGGALYAAALAALAAAATLRLRGGEGWHAPAVALGCVALGVLCAGLRLHSVAAPMLDRPYYGAVEGRIVAVDRSQSDAVRLTLDRVRLGDLPPDRTPVRVRLSLQGDQPWLNPVPGTQVMTTARLAAPEGPVEPGAFDFRRMAFFDRLGAVGYTRVPVLAAAAPQGAGLAVDRLRSRLSAAMRAAIPGDAGAFAAGVMTGDRSGLSQQTVEDLRDSSLAHLLAISGMNMAFLVGFVFALIRVGLACVPPLALRVNAKKVAAVVALAVAAFYLALSGANVATERAFVMVAVMLGAVLLDRRAVTLRSVAIAAVILLAWQPEAMLEPGFQMSFAATVALIAGFRAVEARVAREHMPRWVVPLFTLVLSSVIGGLATAPYAAAHFNRFTDFGLLANLLTVPVMGAVVMPAGAMAALLAPLGLAAPALWVMELGVLWILAVARWVAGLDGAVTAIPAPGALVLPVLTLGLCALVLGPGRLRAAGVAAALAALALWAATPRPALLVAGDGRLVGVLGPEGRALSAARGGGFAARNWLENDGDLAAQADAAARPGMDGPRGARRFAVGGVPGVALSGRGAAEAAAAACARGGIVVVAAEVAADGPCALVDTALLRRTGPLVIDPAPGGGITVRAARAGRRAWMPPQADPAVLAALARAAGSGPGRARP